MRALLGAVALLLAACTIDASIGKDETTGSESGSGTDAAGAQTDGEDAGTSGSGGADSAGGSGEGSGSTAMTAGGTTEGPTDRPAACEPVPDDSACATCRKTDCCPVLEQCLADDACVCVWECVHDGHATDACHETCATDGVLFHDLDACVHAACPDCG